MKANILIGTQKKIKTEARQMKHGELSHVQLPGFFINIENP